MRQHFNRPARSGKFFITFGAISYRFVAALRSAGGRALVLTLNLAGRVRLLLDRLTFSGKLCFAHRTVNYLVIAALCGAGGIHNIFTHRLAGFMPCCLIYYRLRGSFLFALRICEKLIAFGTGPVFNIAVLGTGSLLCRNIRQAVPHTAGIKIIGVRGVLRGGGKFRQSTVGVFKLCGNDRNLNLVLNISYLPGRCGCTGAVHQIKLAGTAAADNLRAVRGGIKRAVYCGRAVNIQHRVGQRGVRAYSFCAVGHGITHRNNFFATCRISPPLGGIIHKQVALNKQLGVIRHIKLCAGQQRHIIFERCRAAVYIKCNVVVYRQNIVFGINCNADFQIY